MSSLTLGIHAPWMEVLRVLDCPVPRGTLPCRVACPLCHGPRLTVYDDSISGGQWHYCPDCGSAGDLLELAAKTWQIDHGTAVRRLHDTCVPYPDDLLTGDAIGEYVAHGPQRRQGFHKLWDSAKEYLAKPNNASLNGLRDRYRLISRLNPEAWRNGPGQLIGALPAKYLNEQLQSLGVTRLSPSTSWAETLLVPYSSLPGQLCGFGLAGRRGAPESRDYCTLNPTRRNRKQEGGLAHLELAEAQRSQYGPLLLVLDDPYLALQIQIRHSRFSTRPLPIVAYADNRHALTRSVWSCLTDKIPVFWGFDITASLVFQAIQANGMLALSKLHSNTRLDPRLRIDHYLRDTEPLRLLRRLCDCGVPWPEALKAWAAEASEGAVHMLVSGLEDYGIEPETLAPIGPRFAAYTKLKNRDRRIIYQQMTVVERDGKWWRLYPEGDRRHRLELICNGVLTIAGARKKQMRPRFFQAHYHGTLTFAGVAVPFECPVGALMKSPWKYLTELSSRADASEPLWIAPQWRNRVLDLALQFSALCGS